MAEADHSWNLEQGALRIGGEFQRAARELKAELVDEGRSVNTLPSGSERLIAIAAAATRRLLAEVIDAENFAKLSSGVSRRMRPIRAIDS